MSDITIRCDCGIYLHATDLAPELTIDMVRTWATHEHQLSEEQQK